jgi:predicted nucleotidyltransferase
MPADTTTTDRRPGVADRERVLRILRQHERELRAQGVVRLRLYGSIARGEAGPESDVDLLAEMDAAADFSLIDHVGLEYRLADLLGRRVEISTAPWKMCPRVLRRIETDAIEVL